MLVRCKDLGDGESGSREGKIHTSWPEIKQEHCEEVTQRGEIPHPRFLLAE